MEWLRSAVCAGEAPEPFFPAGTNEPDPRAVPAAGAARARRPVITRCPSFASGGGRASGAGGGPGEEERVALLRTAGDDPRRTTV